MKKSILSLFVILILSLLFISNIAWAQKTWSGNGNGNGARWGEPTNWTPPGVPIASDDVTIGSTTCQVNINAVCNSLTITGGTMTFGATTLNVSGNWSHEGGTFTPGVGTVIFNGSSAQSISSETFGALTINKTSGDVTLTGAVTVNGSLTLTSGNIITTTNLLTLGALATVSGGSSTSFVDGPLARIKNTAANSTLVFPIGKGTSYRPASLSLTHNDATATTYTAEIFNSAPAARTLPVSIDLVSSVRYWNVTKIGSLVTNASITFYYDTDDGVSDAPNLRIAKDDGAGNWVDLGGTGSGSPSGSITSTTNFTTFSDFVLANATGGTNPLPVELTSFSATVVGSAVKLSWETKTEVSNYGFEIERLKNSKIEKLQDWTKIGFVEGHGNSNSPKHYSFTDNVMGGKYSYRLKQIDTDGQFEYSKIVEVDAGNIPDKIVLEQNYPNPFNPSTTIKFALAETQTAKLVVYDVLGNEVAAPFNGTAEGGKIYEVSFDGTSLSSGIYFYRLATESKVENRKMLLIK